MNLDEPLAKAAAHWPTAVAAGILLLAVAAVCALVVRRTSGAVLTAGIGALIATAFSGDTSWRFAGNHLGMANAERLGLFAAGEIALLACAIMARANKQATATEDTAGTPGVPGVLVWCITGVQIIPAFSESGFWGGVIRAVFGPVMAALLWHIAMGLEIRVARPEALATGLPAQIGHELRERLLSYLGLSTRNRTAEQISRDRATARAVRLGARRWLGPWGRAALAASLARSGAALDGEQRHRLMQQLAGRRSAAEVRTVPVVSPWVPQPVPEPYPSTPLGVTGAELRRMDPLDAVLQIHAAHPEATPAELSSLCTEYGVPVSEARVRIALHAASPAAVPASPEQPQLAAAAQQTPAPEPVPALKDVPVPDAATFEYTACGLHFDLTTEPEVRREFASAVPAATVRARTRNQVHARVPDAVPERFEAPVTAAERPARPHPPRNQVHPEPAVPAPTPETASTDDVLARARALDAEHRRTHNRPASIRALKNGLRVGQAKAERLRALLDGDDS